MPSARPVPRKLARTEEIIKERLKKTRTGRNIGIALELGRVHTPIVKKTQIGLGGLTGRADYFPITYRDVLKLAPSRVAFSSSLGSPNL